MSLSTLSARQIQGRLLLTAAVLVLAYSAILTLSPAALLRTWDAPLRWEHWVGAAVWLALFAAAHHQTIRSLPNADPYLLPVSLLLSAWGTLTIWRLDPYFGLRQTIWSVLAVALLILGARLPASLAFLRRYKYLWLTGGLLLTALTLIFGTNPSGFGPRMWLGCCGIYLQPSEPLKVLLIIYLAAYLAGWASTANRMVSSESQAAAAASPQSRAPSLPLLTPTILMTGMALILLAIQRDLGTAFIFLFLYTAILYATSGEMRVLLVGGIALLLAGTAGYLLFDVVQLRVEAWLNPWLDPSGGSYQIVQSLLAVASGGLFGRGPGLGSPSLVPVAHSDFVFVAIAEESGLVGVIGLLALLALFAARGLFVTLRASDTFRRFLAGGLVFYLIAQGILIIGGNIRLLPLTGVTLPFVSYGGSSLVTSFVSLLLLLHISNQEEGIPAAQPVRPAPYRQAGEFLLLSLAAAAVVTGWWAIVRGPDLLTRTDNPRRAISDRYVHRGAILDRDNQPLSSSSGEPGSITRSIHVPALSSVIGYTHPAFGQAGLEASMDDYLRGLRGVPAATVWWNHLLYGQPPPGLDIRTTLDSNLQAIVDRAIGEAPGAAVLLNPTTGEILAAASHPSFDANQLDETWYSLIQDESSPLLNRALLGRYPAGRLFVDLFPEGPAAFGLDQALGFELPTGDPVVIGGEQTALSPLQASLAAGALTSGGIRPAPVLVSAVNTPNAGWVLLSPTTNPLEALLASTAEERLFALRVPEKSMWEYITAASGSSDETAAWYLGGTMPGRSGAPLTLALVIEDGDPENTAQIGRQILEAAMP